MGADVLCKSIVNYAKQFNWALDHCNIRTDWVMRLDADEIVTPELAEALKLELASAQPSVTGYTINLRRIFFDKWLDLVHYIQYGSSNLAEQPRTL